MGDFNIGALQYRSGSNQGKPTYAPLSDFNPQGQGGFSAEPDKPFSMVMTNPIGTQYRVTGFWVDTNKNGKYDEGDTIRIQMDRADLDPQFAQCLIFKNGKLSPEEKPAEKEVAKEAPKDDPLEQIKIKLQEVAMERARLEGRLQGLREGGIINTFAIRDCEDSLRAVQDVEFRLINERAKLSNERFKQNQK